MIIFQIRSGRFFLCYVSAWYVWLNAIGFEKFKTRTSIFAHVRQLPVGFSVDDEFAEIEVLIIKDEPLL